MRSGRPAPAVRGSPAPAPGRIARLWYAPAAMARKSCARRHVRLPGDIVAPADQRTVGLQRQAVVRTRGDGNEVVARRHVRLPVEQLYSPAGQRTVGLQRQAVVSTRGDGHEVVARRHVRLPVAIVPQPTSEPSDFSARLWYIPRRWPRSRCPPARSSARPIEAPADQRTVATSAPGCGRNPRRWPRSRCPPARSSAHSHCSPSRPANRRTSAPGCGSPRGDGHEVVARRHVRLPVVIVAPAGQRTVGLQRQAVNISRGDGHEVVARRHVRLPVVIVAPADEQTWRGPGWRGNQAGSSAPDSKMVR